MPIINLRGVPHHYELTQSSNPSAPVLIYIHGWLLSHRYWQPLITALSPDYACLAYDLRGFGQSETQSLPPQEGRSPYSLMAYAEDVAALLEQLEIEQAWLIGHSLGGSIALWGADRCPERVKGVI
ncbi:MAG: alpha/beta fold hydrolase, partial [Microcystaceae cyanobacterium]